MRGATTRFVLNRIVDRFHALGMITVVIVTVRYIPMIVCGCGIAAFKSKFDNLPAVFLKQLKEEREQFQKDLRVSVRQMRSSKAARVTRVTLIAAVEVRAKVGLSESDFAKLRPATPVVL